MDNIRTSWIGVVVYRSPKHQTAEGIGGTSTRLTSFQWAFLILLTPIKRALKSPGGFLFPETPGVLGLTSILMTPPEIWNLFFPDNFHPTGTAATKATATDFCAAQPSDHRENRSAFPAQKQPTRPRRDAETAATAATDATDASSPTKKRKKARATDATSTHLPPTRADEQTSDAAMDAARGTRSAARPC